MKLNIKLYFQYLYSEILLAALSSAVIIFLTYWLDGANGVYFHYCIYLLMDTSRNY